MSPYLDYCVQIWLLNKNNILKFWKESKDVQQNWCQNRDFEFSERLKRLGLTTLKEIRVRGGGIIQTYKFITREADIDLAVFF